MNPEKIGRYEIKSELGRGGMATVFLAHDPLIGRDVAVKVLPREFMHDPSFRGRFEREARTIAMLEHPAIVPIYDFGEKDGQPFIVMRLMKGGSLEDRIKNGPLPLQETAAILNRLAAALDHAHNNGVIHRDLKPGNILFDEYGQAFLSDFGIVKLAQETVTFTGGSIIGTPAYMSPEQVHGEKEVDARSDIYTLGVILFEMLTGHMPYRADTPARLMMAHVLNPIPRILDVNPGLPAGCNNIIQKAMAKNRDARYATAGDLSSAVARTTTGENDTAPPATVAEGATIVETAPPPPRERERPQPRQKASPAAQATPIAAPPASAKPRRRWFIPAIVGAAGLVLCCGVIIAVTQFPAAGALLGLGGEERPFAAVTAIVEEDGAAASSTPTPAGEQIDDDATRRAALTATADAQAEAIATRVAESTATAAARLGATATVQAQQAAATAQFEASVAAIMDEILAVQQTTPAFGPSAGSLVHVADGFIKSDYAGLAASDFVAEAIFYTPYAPSAGGWDIGFMFREADVNEQLRLIVDSELDWALTNRIGDESEDIAFGSLTNLNENPGDPNRITLYAQGATGYFFLNGDFIATLDLSARTTAGDIAAATSFYTGDEIEGEATDYEAFAVWNLDS